MRKRVFEPAGVGVMLGLLMAALLGQRHNALRLVFALIAAVPFTLGAPEALRRAVGQLTSRAELAGNARTAMLLALAGGAAAVCFAPVLVQNQVLIQQFFPIYDFALDEIQYWLGAAGALTVVRCASVCFAAEGDQLSFFLTELLGGGAMLTALMLTLNTPNAAEYCMYASLILMVVILLVARLHGRSEGSKIPWRRSFAWLRDVPAAWLRLLLFPLLAAAGMRLCAMVPASPSIPPLFPDGLSLPVLAGVLLSELPRSPFRRDGEGFGAWTATAALAVALAAAGYSLLAPATTHAMVDVPLYQKFVAAKAELMVLASMTSGLILYAKPNARSISTMILLLIAAAAPVLLPILAGALTHSTLLWGALTALAAALIAAALYLPEASRQLRLARIQKMRRAAGR